MMLFKSGINALFGVYTDIHDAAAYKNLDAIRKILINDPSCIDTLDPTGSQGLTPLQIMVLNKYFSGVTLLLEYDADINKRSKTGMTALVFPCVHPQYTNQEREDMINLLVGAGARLDLKNSIDARALTLFKKNYPEIYNKFSDKITTMDDVSENKTYNTLRRRLIIEAKK